MIKNYILLIIFTLGIITSCTLKRGVNEGDWNAFIIDISTNTEVPMQLTINESKVYWDVFYTVYDSKYRLEAEQKKDSLFLTDVRHGYKYSLKILSKTEIEGKVRDGDEEWNFRAVYKENQ